MKRILALVLVLLISLTSMVGCDQITEIAGKIPFIGDLINKDNGGDNNDVVYDVDAAKEFIKQMYKDGNPETSRNYDVAAQCIIGGVRYEVTWTVDNDAVKIQASETKGFWTVVIPSKNDAAVNYKLTATIKAGDNTTAEVSFDRIIPVIDSTGITSTPVEGVAYKLYMNQVNLAQKLYALSTDEQDHKYIQTTNDASKAADFYVEKVDGGYKFYTLIDGVKNYVYAQGIEKDGKVSKYIGFSTENATVFNYVAETNSWQTTIDGTKYCVGTYNTYKTICISEATYITAENTGVSQFVVEFMTSAHANTLTPDAEPETITDSAKVIEKLYSLADGEVAGGTFVVTGVITELDSYGNPTIVVTGLEDKPVLCYKLTDDRFVVGATITVSSKMLKNYKGTYELMECTLKNITLPGADSNTPTVSVVDVPEVGVAYKLGLFHGNEAADVFFNGNIYVNNKGKEYPWYLAYAGIADAIDVYLEAVEGVEGSYRLYFMNGEAKTYIRMYPRDGDTTQGTMELTTTVPTECYTYNAEYKTLVYTSTTGEQFYMGSSGTYTSISTSAISYISNSDSYPCHFYAAGATGSTTPDPTPDPDPVPSMGIIEAPVAGTAYKFGLINPTKDNNVYYISGGMAATYYLATSSDLAAALDVYLEATEGGYYLYVMDNGAKLYINFTVNDTHVNSVYENTAATVFTYDATLKTVVTNVNDATYAIGTRNDKNYTTVGPVDVSRDPFICNFYGEVEGGTTPAPSCEHTNTTTTTVDATCTAAGSTTVVCDDCGKTVSTTAIAALGHDYAEGVCSKCGENEPAGPVEMTISEALNATVGAQVKLTGTVSEIYYTWNTQYNNMSVYITDDSGARIIVFRTTVQVKIGDVVTVIGTIDAYKEVNQIAEGNTLTIDTPHVCTFSDATCLSPKTCPVCGATEGTVTDHNYGADGKCTTPGCVAQVGVETTTVSLNINDYATANGWVNATKYTTFTYEDVVYTAAGTDDNTGKFYTKAPGSWRFYSSGNATLTITAPEGKTIQSVTIVWSEGGLSIDGTAMVSGEAMVVNGNSIVISATAKTFINSIVIVYA